MSSNYYALSCLLLALSSLSRFCASSFLDLKELQSLEYSIEIDSKPVLIEAQLEGQGQQQQQQIVVPMVNRFGQTYHCVLPKVEQQDESGGGNPENESESGAKEDEFKTSIDFMDTLKGNLEPLKGNCLKRQKDWWTYEYCHEKHVRQFRVEEGKVVGKVVDLGFFDHDHEWQDKDIFVDQEVTRSKEVIKFHSQFYTNGTKCDLTGNLRRTEVKFFCDPSAVVAAIVRVEEPVSCEYELTVATSRICNLPGLKPPTPNEPREIRCRPALDRHEFEKYEKMEVLKREKEEKRKFEMREVQKQHMRDLIGDRDAEIDLDSEEGFQKVEEMVQEKLANRLVSQLGQFLAEDEGGDLLHSGGIHVFDHGSIFPFKAKKHFASKKEEFFSIIDEYVEFKKEKEQLQKLLGAVLPHRSAQKKAIDEEEKVKVEQDELRGQDEKVIYEDEKIEVNRDEQHHHGEKASEAKNQDQQPDAGQKMTQPEEVKRDELRSQDEKVIEEKEKVKVLQDELQSQDKKVIDEQEKIELKPDEQRHQGEKVENAREAKKQNQQPVAGHKMTQPEVKDKGQNEDQYDLEEERRVRSDLVSEDEMLDDLKDKLRKISSDKISTLEEMMDSDEFHRDIKDMIDESETETRAKLSPEQRLQINEFAEGMKEIIKKLERTEEEIKKIDDEIRTLNAEKQELEKDVDINQREHYKHDDELSVKKELREEDHYDVNTDEREHYNHDDELSVKKELREEDHYDGNTDEREHYKHDNKLLVKKELREEDYDDEYEEDSVQVVKVDSVSNVAALENTHSEQKVLKRVEAAVKEKLKSSGFDTGGRQIEVKVIASIPSMEDGENPFAGLTHSGEDQNEAQQVQGMIHNLMMGDTKAYKDLDSQRRSEKNYKFQWSAEDDD